MAEIVSRPLSWFKPDPTQPRKRFEPEDLQRLGDSLKKRQLVPGIALPDGTLVDGERRWRAAQMVGVACLDVVIVPQGTTPGDAKDMQLITSLHRQDLTPWELYCGCIEWRKLHPGSTARELAAAIDLTEGYVSRILSLDKCLPVVREAAEAGRIGVADWHPISQAPDADQHAMLMDRLNGATREGMVRRSVKSGGCVPVRVSSVKIALATASVVIKGDGIDLDQAIDSLAEALKEAKKARDQGLDARTFAAVMRDKSKAG